MSNSDYDENYSSDEEKTYTLFDFLKEMTDEKSGTDWTKLKR